MVLLIILMIFVGSLIFALLFLLYKTKLDDIVLFIPFFGIRYRDLTT